jgi:hypothetical protein
MRDDQPGHPDYCKLCARLLQGRCVVLKRLPDDEDKRLCHDAGWRDVPWRNTFQERHSRGTGEHALDIEMKGGLTR